MVCRKTGKKREKAILSGETVLAEYTDGLWNMGRTRSSPQRYSPLIFDTVPQGNVLEKLDVHIRKSELRSLLSLCTKEPMCNESVT